METIDPGHRYKLANLDWAEDLFPGPTFQEVYFVKREGEGYPGNVGSHQGTTVQEFMRMICSRVKYCDNQIPNEMNKVALYHARGIIEALEIRAAMRHGRKIPEFWYNIEDMPTCPKCMHIGCEGKCHE